MNKRKAIIAKHPYAINQNDRNGRWYTRFKVDGAIVQRNRKTKEEIEDIIVSFYLNGETFEEESPKDVYTFQMGHDRWMEMQEEYGKNPNTIYKYEADWRRFFQGTEFANKDLLFITPKDIEIFMIDKIRSFNLKRQGGVTLYGYIDGVFYNAVMDRIVPVNDNPCLHVDKKKFNKYYNKSTKSNSQRTMSPNNISDLINTLHEDINNNEEFLPPYGVMLSLLTGMRSGEICGLRWSNVFDNYIHICEAECYNSMTKEYFQASTKTGKDRDIPITDELHQFFLYMKEFQSSHGMFDDFVISKNGEKLRTRRLSDYMIKRSKKLGFECSKNIHTIRRTFNSCMREDGVSALTAGSIIGNTVQVNDSHYTYDLQDLQQKSSLVTNAENKILAGNCLIRR